MGEVFRQHSDICIDWNGDSGISDREDKRGDLWGICHWANTVVGKETGEWRMKTWDDVARHLNCAVLALEEAINTFECTKREVYLKLPYIKSWENTADSEGYIETEFGEN